MKILFSLTVVCLVLLSNTSFAQIPNSKFSSDLDGKTYSFNVYSATDNSLEFKATTNLKIISTIYLPPSKYGSGGIKFKCWDNIKKKNITIYFDNTNNYFNGVGCNDYCGCGDCYFKNSGLLNYIRSNYLF
jgi:hypothetical protein